MKPLYRQTSTRWFGENLPSATRAKTGKVESIHSLGKLNVLTFHSWYGSKIWHSTDKYRKVIWQCNHKFGGGEKCKTPHLSDEELETLTVSAVNKLIANKSQTISAFDTIKDTVFDTFALETEQDELQNEQLIVSELMQQCIEENSRVALDQSEYNKRFDSLTSRFDTAKARLEEVTAIISDKQTRQASIEDFLASLKKQDSLVTDFTADLWYSLVDFVTVHSKDDVRVTFKDGTEIRA